MADGDAPPDYPMQKQASPPTGYDESGYSQTVITTQPTQVTFVALPPLGSGSQRMTCPHCRADMSTNVTYEAGSRTHLVALCICCFIGWLGCCLIPYCIDGCKDAQHECPNCHQVIGVASAFS